MGLGGDARRELARLNLDEAQPTATPAQADEVPLRERALWLTAALLDRGRVWNASHAIPRYTLTDYKRTYPKGAGAAAWRLSYPRAYPEYVAAHSATNEVPQFLQLAIMREESAFSPTIESFANAIGLTQMLVKTAQRFSDKPVTRETLFDPANNIALGSKFLGFLLNHFNRAIPLAIPGYNAGEAAVDRWLAERGERPLDEFIETIPYDETRGYTKRVLATYFTYTWLYGQGDPVPHVAFSLKPTPTKAPPQRSARRPPARR
jgi:soluble lytic murein transglycosylase